MIKVDYTNRYLARSERNVQIFKDLMESGMICSIWYRCTYLEDNVFKAHTSKIKGLRKKSEKIPIVKLKKYLMLILHTGYPKTGNDKKVHCLRLDLINPHMFDFLTKKVGTDVCKNIASFRRVKLERLLLVEEKSKRFYIENLKPKIHTNYNDSYRTIFLNQITKIQVHKFKFKE